MAGVILSDQVAEPLLPPLDLAALAASGGDHCPAGAALQMRLAGSGVGAGAVAGIRTAGGVWH